MHVVRRVFENAGKGDKARRFYPLGDAHIGAAAADLDLLRHNVDRIAAESNSYWFSPGDLFDAICARDKRFDSRELDRAIWERCNNDISQYLPECLDTALDILWPIMHKCLGLMEGNHEHVARVAHGINFTDRFITEYKKRCKLTKTPVNPWVENLESPVAFILRFKFGGDSRRMSTVIAYVHHGAGGAQTLTGKLGKLERVVSWLPDASLFICGHFHDTAVHPVKVLRVVTDGDNPHTVAQNAWVCLVPSFFRTHATGCSTYAGRAQYPPSVLGVVPIDIEPFRCYQDGVGHANRHCYDRPRISITLGDEWLD